MHQRCGLFSILVLLLLTSLTAFAGDIRTEPFFLGGAFDAGLNSANKKQTDYVLLKTDPTTKTTTPIYSMLKHTDLGGIQSQAIIGLNSPGKKPIWIFNTPPGYFVTISNGAANKNYVVISSDVAVVNLGFPAPNYVMTLCEFSDDRALLAMADYTFQIMDSWGHMQKVHSPLAPLLGNESIRKMVPLESSGNPRFVAITTSRVFAFSIDPNTLKFTLEWNHNLGSLTANQTYLGSYRIWDLAARGTYIRILVENSVSGSQNIEPYLIDHGGTYLRHSSIPTSPQISWRVGLADVDSSSGAMLFRTGTDLNEYTDAAGGGQPVRKAWLDATFFYIPPALRQQVGFQYPMSPSIFNVGEFYERAWPITAQSPGTAMVATAASPQVAAPATPSTPAQFAPAQPAAASPASVAPAQPAAAPLVDAIDTEIQEHAATINRLELLNPEKNPDKFGEYLDYLIERYNSQRGVKKIDFQNETTAGKLPFILRLFHDWELAQYLRPPYLSEKDLASFGLKLSGTDLDTIDEKKVIHRNSLVSAVKGAIKARMHSQSCEKSLQKP